MPKTYVKTIPDELLNNPNYSNFFDGKEKKGFQLMKGVADKNDSCKVMFDEIFSN